MRRLKFTVFYRAVATTEKNNNNQTNRINHRLQWDTNCSQVPQYLHTRVYRELFSKTGKKKKCSSTRHACMHILHALYVYLCISYVCTTRTRYVRFSFVLNTRLARRRVFFFSRSNVSLEKISFQLSRHALWAHACSHRNIIIYYIIFYVLRVFEIRGARLYPRCCTAVYPTRRKSPEIDANRRIGY